jgi:hypothetical protein
MMRWVINVEKSVKGHKWTHASQRAVGLFDQLVGTARQREWKRDTKGGGGLEVDD